ncbi:hypothetical protein AV530_018806 [Patagioenas fasciata monilis]|uniref:Uncharacterized protein n=1 Tax=Patagioenas fasciata monilis TaxID=372326 RepID=A0A1V4JJL3_PATFA|nr:hypothetical protein AV530_018806 [Patagioenas fasciata monilis]
MLMSTSPEKEKPVCLLSHAVEDLALPRMARRISAGKLRTFRRPMQLAWVKAKNSNSLFLHGSHIVLLKISEFILIPASPFYYINTSSIILFIHAWSKKII